MHVWNLLHAAPCKYRTQKWRQKSPSGHHRATLSGCIFANKARIDNRKKLLKSNISSTCPDNTANFGPLATEIGSRVWGTPANFNGFSVLASLLQWRRSTDANWTLHGVWPSPGLVHYIVLYIFWGSCLLTEFRHMQYALCVQVLRSLILTALLDSTPAPGSAKLCSVVQGMELPNVHRGRHLISSGRPSRSASDHILVLHFVPVLLYPPTPHVVSQPVRTRLALC